MSVIKMTEDIYNLEEFMDAEECLNNLGIRDVNLSIINAKGLITKYKSRRGKINVVYYKKEEVEKIKKMQEDFFENHVSIEEARNILTEKAMKEINRVVVPPYVRKGKFKGTNKAIAKKEFEKFISYKTNNKKTTLSQDEILKDYYSYEEMKEKLGLYRRAFEEIIRKGGCKIGIFNKRSYYLKKDIDEVVSMQEEGLKLYIDNVTAIERYTRTIVNRVKPIPIPLYLRKDKFINKISMYSIKELEENKRFHELGLSFFDNIDKGVDIEDSFIKKLELYFELNNLDLKKFRNQSNYTLNKWIGYILCKLQASRASNDFLKKHVIYNVYYTHELYKMLNINGNFVEIYTLTTEYLEKCLNEIPKSYAKVIIFFLDDVYDDLKLEMKKHGVSNKKVFDIYKIRDKFIKFKNETKSLLQPDIYSIDEFLKIFEYCIDIDEHIKNAVYEIINNKTATYTSVWLYSTIHLNNGWRHGDIVKFQEVYIDDLLDMYKIYNEEYFLDNKLTLAQAQVIISRIVDREFIISKTRMSGHFFCCDEVSPSIATAIVLLTLYNKKLQLKSDDDLLKFNTKSNMPTSSQIGNFFRNIEIDNFKFGSKKMNATLITLIYSITYEGSGDGDKALQYVRKIRSHTEDSSSTLHYININNEDILNLSRILFDRGEFGYIYNKLAKNIYANDETLSNKNVVTEKMKELREILGPMFNIEQLCGFMHGHLTKKKLLLKEFDCMSFEEKTKLLTEMYMGNLISKEEGIHCILGVEKCLEEDGLNINCTCCPYSIITLYALHDICDSFLKNLYLYKNETLPGEKIKLSVKLNHLAEHIINAFERFGKEVVSYYFSMSFKKFVDEYSMLDMPEDIYTKTSLV